MSRHHENKQQSIVRHEKISRTDDGRSTVDSGLKCIPDEILFEKRYENPIHDLDPSSRSA
eukprot:scaffold11046_cov183-Amphora_coffeaeformis.AAC.5